jgi:hypothetical protein
MTMTTYTEAEEREADELRDLIRHLFEDGA